MENITRRDFMRELGGIAGLSVVPNLASGKSRNYENIRLNEDWDNAIEEDNLRQEVSDLMRETKKSIGYHVRINEINIFSSNIPMEKLQRIKDVLKKGYIVNTWTNDLYFIEY